jgi:ribonuclease D
MRPNQIPFIQFPGKIHLITSDEQCAQLVEPLLMVEEFGFDTETRPSFKKGEVHTVSLLQLATDSDAYLFRLHKLNQFEILKQILENKEVLKVGVAVRDDLKTLQKRFVFAPQNVIELQSVAKAKGLLNMGLKGMAEEVLGGVLSKRAKITNWEMPHLTDAQVRYAATDAWVGLAIYRKVLALPS